jgi:hypothetical protein
MIIEYNVECFERTLVIKCDNIYAEHEQDIMRILDEAYYAWHSPEDIEDEEEREWVENDACCEEYMISKMSEVYPVGEEDWNSFYYGRNVDEIEEDMENHQYDHDYNMRWLKEVLDDFEDKNYQFEPFEKLGNEAYWIVKDCIEKLKNLKEKI